ncbi:SDR family NAD(P)-dependent oxidoreductase [Novosphingobium sp. G106]|uniref:SDR family NAD(P)-dependent oxidoreductase n=1 Tax=Novosphingobium sp. G106 TaxID=2849500 RepID=UPI001C2CD78B|nr:SDR family NAD(P)-dependent oxidoreductase [Novosphingobium sp. G106]MBV1687289.1 SDR family NAD(P)-dependent oxidoreductase [Novosphingobium sp. G106]
MSTLSGRTCLITGASSGFGAHFARITAAAGARVALAARRKERIEALAEELRAGGTEAVAVAMDVTDEASVIAAFDAAEAALGPVDTVIANAGVSSPGRATEVPAEAMATLLNTNVLGVFLTAREGAKRMMAAGSRDNGRGRILLIGSMGAETPVKGEVMYCASKAAVARMGRNLAGEWVRSGVNVNVLQPGFILTELADDWFGSEAGKAQIATFPRKRMQPIESLDPMVLYLCSDASSAMTGSVITIDDGHSL